MNLAVLSGKGGTGKTLVSANLAAAAGAVYVDCDVEEPNGYLFFRVEDPQVEQVCVPVPQFRPEACTGCRTCVDFCQFGALAFVGGKPFLFPEICHACGGCTDLCPAGAVREIPRPIGTVAFGRAGGVTVLGGRMELGNASGVPIIQRLVRRARDLDAPLTIFDCPPGSACPAMESIRTADFCLLVAEPTVFGAHNLAMVHELARVFRKPVGAVLNKCGAGEDPSEAYCLAHHIPVLARIPYDSELGLATSRAELAAAVLPRYEALFTGLLAEIRKEAGV